MPQHGRTACQRNGQARRLQDGLVATRQRSGQGTLNAEAAHRLPVEWTELIKYWGDTSPTSGVDRRRGLFAINAEAARPRGLMSASARWLTSWAVGHVATSGLRLSGEQKCTRHGPDTCRLRTPACSWLRSGYSLSQNSGTLLWVARTHTEGSGSCPWRSWALPGGLVRIYRGPALSHGGPDPLLMSWSISSSLVAWWPRSHPRGGVGCFLPRD
jgi:hypothetical protein